MDRGASAAESSSSAAAVPKVSVDAVVAESGLDAGHTATSSKEVTMKVTVDKINARRRENCRDARVRDFDSATRGVVVSCSTMNPPPEPG